MKKEKNKSEDESEMAESEEIEGKNIIYDESEEGQQ